QPVVGGAHHLPPDARGLAVPRRRGRPVLPTRGRLVDGRPYGESPGRRCPGPGRRAPPARRGAAGAFRPRQPVRERPLPTPPGSTWHHLRHEPPRRLLG